MSPDSQPARVARLEAQMTSVLEDLRREREKGETFRSELTDYRSLISDSSLVGATNTTRIKGVEEDISEMKGMLRHLAEHCATKEDFKRLEDAASGRQQMSTARFTAVLTVIGAIVVALIAAAAQIVGSI